MTNANALLVTSQVGCSTPLKKNISYFFFLILQWCGMVGRDGPAVWIVVRKVGRDTWREEMAKRLLLLFKSKMWRCVFRQKKTLQFQRKTLAVCILHVCLFHSSYQDGRSCPQTWWSNLWIWSTGEEWCSFQTGLSSRMWSHRPWLCLVCGWLTWRHDWVHTTLAR